MKNHKIILYILIFTALSLGLTRLIISNNMSTSGTVLGKVSEELSKYQTENLLLSEKVLNLSSFLNISKKADKLGFQPKKTAYSITSVLPIAVKP
ncbi:MAG: hypothetical protein A2W22_03660 [Candidatus Levybacteria bacterium RBG_16_35_11]|nr:MAG: hypothetical protein A2W22_03660 [Candidatus Levybacteria bacterium RBG_16_35_11]